jgi:hypothetical protein
MRMSDLSSPLDSMCFTPGPWQELQAAEGVCERRPVQPIRSGSSRDAGARGRAEPDCRGSGGDQAEAEKAAHPRRA